MALMTSTQVTSPNVINCVNIDVKYMKCMSKNYANKSQIYLTSSISLVGNVDNLENTFNSTPIENPFLHDHCKVDRL